MKLGLCLYILPYIQRITMCPHGYISFYADQICCGTYFTFPRISAQSIISSLVSLFTLGVIQEGNNLVAHLPSALLKPQNQNRKSGILVKPQISYDNQ